MLNNNILNHVLKMLMMMISKARMLRRRIATRRLKLKPKLNDVLRMHATVIG